jgi:hypothetical protein
VPPAADATLPIDGAVRGVAGDGATVFALVDASGKPIVSALRNGAATWRAELAGAGAPALVRAGSLIGAVVSARPATRDETGATAGRDPGVRGDPAAIVIGLDAATGTKKWAVLFDSTEYAVITSIAPLGDDIVVGGLFAGTLRANTRVVTSAGGSDGFVARLRAGGEVAWLVRTGGAGADGIQGVATRGSRIAIAGTFSTGAELGGTTLAMYDERSPYADAYAAELDDKGTRLWSATFGARTDDTVAGVTIDASGHVVVAASGREVIHVGSTQLVTQGEGDGVLVWLGDHGEYRASILVGGMDFDGLRAITSVGDKTIVGGFFSGKLQLGDRALVAGGGDDSFLAAYDPNGTLATSWHVGGDGREEITSLSAIPGGFVAGVAFTANARIEDAKLAAPKDPMAGSAIVVRGVP